jgi:hypothetical protein
MTNNHKPLGKIKKIENTRKETYKECSRDGLEEKIRIG